ncbi:hypothetical protein ABZ543_16645 [Streptomyces roseifaciens]
MPHAGAIEVRDMGGAGRRHPVSAQLCVGAEGAPCTGSFVLEALGPAPAGPYGRLLP